MTGLEFKAKANAMVLGLNTNAKIAKAFGVTERTKQPITKLDRVPELYELAV